MLEILPTWAAPQPNPRLPILMLVELERAGLAQAPLQMWVLVALVLGRPVVLELVEPEGLPL